MDVMGGKITFNLKELTKNKKIIKPHAHRKRARRALRRERTLELRQ
jgi:hypothetical protein